MNDADSGWSRVGAPLLHLMLLMLLMLLIKPRLLRAVFVTTNAAPT